MIKSGCTIVVSSVGAVCAQPTATKPVSRTIIIFQSHRGTFLSWQTAIQLGLYPNSIKGIIDRNKIQPGDQCDFDNFSKFLDLYHLSSQSVLI